MNSTVLSKTMENVRKHCNIKLATKDESRKYYELEPNYLQQNGFQKCFWQLKKVEMSKPVYVGFCNSWR